MNWSIIPPTFSEQRDILLSLDSLSDRAASKAQSKQMRSCLTLRRASPPIFKPTNHARNASAASSPST